MGVLEGALDAEFSSDSSELSDYRFVDWIIISKPINLPNCFQRLLAFQVTHNDGDGRVAAGVVNFGDPPKLDAASYLSELERLEDEIEQQLRSQPKPSSQTKRDDLWRENNRLDRTRDALLMSMEADRNLETLYQENMDLLRLMNPYVDAFNIDTGSLQTLLFPRSDADTK
jgi:hypothetical protein